MTNDSAADPAERFFELLARSLQTGTLVKLVLGKHRGAEPDLQRLSVRPLLLRGEPHLSFVYSHRTKDITKNHPVAEGVALLRSLAGEAFAHVHLLTTTEDVQLSFSRKGKPKLHRHAAQRADAPPAQAHDREKHRFLDLGRPFLAELGVTDAQHKLVPAMARKWKQINKFVEVLDHAFESSPLKHSADTVHVMDFGAGKGYLTFAVHDYLQHTLGRPTRVTGVELRDDLVQLCGSAAHKLELGGLVFKHGDVRTFEPERIDVMIALHACDTATDYALHMGIRAGASIILCSPCCHKQIRPQMTSPPLLKPMLQHGIHLGQQAEMVTDSLRALLLEAQGYDTQVFEFVSLEHTSKNKMILAVKRAQPKATDAARQVQEIKAFYGIQQHCLETLLADGAPRPPQATTIPQGERKTLGRPGAFPVPE